MKLKFALMSVVLIFVNVDTWESGVYYRGGDPLTTVKL